ncbi:MAG: UvrD-helicase domain-containing protein, partial [Aquabacterium sp.]|nr:UvrD-helicase domain-containing protein [Aquabacterium sp.]
MTAPQALDVFTVPLGGVRLIEASAGTGKTWAICGLYLRLLLQQRCTVQQILVVTFTNAATAELRERLRQRLVDTLAGLDAPAATTSADPFVPSLLASLRAQGADPADLALRLRQALLGFDEAAIFTIHGFCQRALADTPLAAQMPLVQDLLADDSAVLAEAVHDQWRR